MHVHAWFEWLLSDGWRDLGQAVVMGTVASWIALIFHELGHAAAAWMVRVRIWGIRLGVGPTIWRGRLGQCRVHLATLPFLGAVHLLDEDARAIGYRDIARGSWRFVWGPRAWRAPIISAAGGIGNLLGLLLAIHWWHISGEPSLGTPTGDLFLFTMAANFAGYLNLLPCFRSDGIHLLAHARAARLSWAAAGGPDSPDGSAGLPVAIRTWQGSIHQRRKPLPD